MAATAIELLHSSGPYIAVHLRYEVDWIVHKGNETLRSWHCHVSLGVTHGQQLRVPEFISVDNMYIVH